MVNVQRPIEFDTLLGPSEECEYRRYPGATVACALLDYGLEELCSCEACPLRELVRQPYCPECGSVRPEWSMVKTCMPCLKKGHISPLVTDDALRIVRIQMAYKFYDLHDYRSGRDTIPGWRNKIDPPVSARKEGSA